MQLGDETSEDGAGSPSRTGQGSLEPERHRYRITLLGQFALHIDGRPVELPSTTGRLAAVVALGGDHGRSRLAGMLWPDTTEDRARASLRSALWQAGQIAPGLLRANGSVQLDLEVEVDVHALGLAAHQLMSGNCVDPTDLALRKYCERELLPDWDDEWLVPERERLQQVQLHVLEAIACACVERGLFGLAIDAALAALKIDPLRESAHRTVIRAHLAEGNYAAALRAYRECVRVLDDEFGIEPSHETTALVSERKIPAPRVRDRLHEAAERLHSMTTWASLLVLVGA